MSIVCMKRNSRHNPRIDPISANGFSLNGGYRNVGGVGRFRLISNVTRTPFRGNEPMGTGGTNGTYNISICNSGSCCTNDPQIIKPSSVNTAGMIDKRYQRKWDETQGKYICPRLVLNSQYPYSWTQARNVNNDQSTFIRNKTQQAASYEFINPQNNGPCSSNTNANAVDANAVDANASEAELDTNTNTCTGNKNACSYFIGTTKHIRTPYAKNFNQPAMSQAQYLSTGGPARRNCLPTPASMQPFPMNLAHSHGCNVNYNTWQEAQAAGLLPENYVG